MAASLHIAGIRKVFGKGDKAVEILKKIDIEGAEYDLLFKCPVHILRKVSFIGVEYHQGFESINKNNSRRGLNEFLSRNGFEVLRDRDSVILARNTLARGKT